MAGSDVTYLESFVEDVATLPHEIRRNLDLIKSLDVSSASILEEMIRLQQEYVTVAEQKILELEVVEGKGIRANGSDVVVPTTEELAEYIHDADKYNKIRKIQSIAVQHAEEKCAIANQAYSLAEGVCHRLDDDLSHLEKVLQSSGEFQAPGAAKPDDLAAIQPTVGGSDWILAKVISHDPQTGIYKLSDEDVESNKTFSLTESQVVILGRIKNLSRGDVVYAVYPDTTSFYQATVVQPPSRKTGGASGFLMLNFLDDEDADGIIHDKAVQVKHVMRPPFGG